MVLQEEIHEHCGSSHVSLNPSFLYCNYLSFVGEEQARHGLLGTELVLKEVELVEVVVVSGQVVVFEAEEAYGLGLGIEVMNLL